MTYTITEDECNKLEAVRGQLGLVAGLLTATGAHGNLYETSDLYEFLAAQISIIQGVIKALYQRFDAERDENNRLSWVDWLNMLQVVSGRRSMRDRDLKRLGQKLQNSTVIDPDMVHVFNLWKAVMTNDGEIPFRLEPSSTDDFNIYFPERVAVIQEPEPTPKATVKKAAPRKPDKLAAKAAA